MQYFYSPQAEAVFLVKIIPKPYVFVPQERTHAAAEPGFPGNGKWGMLFLEQEWHRYDKSRFFGGQISGLRV